MSPQLQGGFLSTSAATDALSQLQKKSVVSPQIQLINFKGLVHPKMKMM